MAENDEAGEKTEQVSQRRMRQAWDDGKIPVGKDLATFASLGVGGAALILAAGSLRGMLTHVVTETAASLDAPSFDALGARIGVPLTLVLGLCAAPALGVAVATLAQTKGGFWPNLANPDPERVFSVERITRLFKKEFLADLGMSLVKVVALGWAFYSALRADFLTLPRTLLSSGVDAQLALSLAPLGRAFAKVAITLLAVAGADLALTRYRFNSRMKMTREEAKREYKEEEGDPMIRGRRRKRHRELARGRASVEVPQADALVVNPTHIAIAIRYRRAEGKAPRVTAKGKGKLAEHMRELARANGIPIIEDIPLARLLYRRVKVGGQVPAETYRAVAAILAFVYRVTGRNPSAGAGA